MLDDYADADKWLTRSLARNPRDSDGWYALGRTKYTENRFEESIHAFEQCLKLDPKNVKAEDNLGLSYYGLGRRGRCARRVQNGHRVGVAGGAERSGTVHRSWDALPRAESPEGRAAIPSGSDADCAGDAKGHEKLGKTFSQLDELPKAQSELERAVALAPEVASLHYMLGQIYRKQGLMDKAKAEFQRTEELNGTHSSSQTMQ